MHYERQSLVERTEDIYNRHSLKGLVLIRERNSVQAPSELEEL